MTTAWKANQSPRLPDNHPAHVERVLAKAAKERPSWWPRIIAAVVVLIVCAVLASCQ